MIATVLAGTAAVLAISAITAGYSPFDGRDCVGLSKPVAVGGKAGFGAEHLATLDHRHQHQAAPSRTTIARWLRLLQPLMLCVRPPSTMAAPGSRCCGLPGAIAKAGAFRALMQLWRPGDSPDAWDMGADGAQMLDVNESHEQRSAKAQRRLVFSFQFLWDALGLSR